MYVVNVEVKVQHVGGHVSDKMFQHLEKHCHKVFKGLGVKSIQKRVSGDTERRLSGLHVVMNVTFDYCDEAVVQIELREQG